MRHPRVLIIMVVLRARAAATLTVLSLLVLSSDLPSQERSGFWIGYGYGAVPTVGQSCTGCFSPAEWTSERGGGALVVDAGFAVNPRLLAGIGINFIVAGGDTNTSVLAALALLRHYPFAGRPLHVQGGAGVTSISFGRPGGGVEAPGWAAQFRVGYDVRVWRNVAATPFASLTAIRRGTGSLRTSGNAGPVTEIRGGTIVTWGVTMHMY